MKQKLYGNCNLKKNNSLSKNNPRSIHLFKKAVVNKTKQIEILEEMKSWEHKHGIAKWHAVFKHFSALDGWYVVK